jgi:hypothetical protein
MNDKSLVDKLKIIAWGKKEKHRNLIHQREWEAHEVFVVNLQMQEAGHVAHFRVANPTLLQAWSSKSSPNYDLGKRI